MEEKEEVEEEEEEVEEKEEVEENEEMAAPMSPLSPSPAWGRSMLAAQLRGKTATQDLTELPGGQKVE